MFSGVFLVSIQVYICLQANVYFSQKINNLIVPERIVKVYGLISELNSLYCWKKYIDDFNHFDLNTNELKIENASRSIYGYS